MYVLARKFRRVVYLFTEEIHLLKSFVFTALISVASVFAAPITFTFTGTDSGSLGGTPFASTAFTITATADTNNIVANPCCGATSGVINDSTSIDISGVGTFNFVTATEMWWTSGSSFGGLGEYGGNPSTVLGPNLINVSDSSIVNWGENTSVGPLNPQFSMVTQWKFSNIQTSGGTLILDDASGNPISVFEASTGSTTPEPSSLLLIGAGLIGLAARRRIRV